MGELQAFCWLQMTLLIAAFDLWRVRLPDWLATAIERVTAPPFVAVDRLHTGIVSDYVAWITVGLAIFAAALAFG